MTTLYLNDKFSFGKYRGKYVEEVLQADKNYIPYMEGKKYIKVIHEYRSMAETRHIKKMDKDFRNRLLRED